MPASSSSIIVLFAPFCLHVDLTCYLEVAFFVSPIPIHVAALLITFLTIIEVDTLALGLAADNVGMVIHIIPYF